MSSLADRTERSRAVTAAAPDPYSLPLDQIDVSRAEYWSSDTAGPLFERLRREDPVHWCAESTSGPYWSITSFQDVKFVDSHHEIYSSQIGGITIADQDLEPEVQLDNFIAMDQPKHDEQRKTVAPSVAPTNLALFEPLIRERAADILDNLPSARRSTGWTWSRSS
jgi:cytochrome P450